MVGPLRTGRSGFTHLLVAVGKFTTWIDAKPIKDLDVGTAISVIRELVFRDGVPHRNITDNGQERLHSCANSSRQVHQMD